MRTWLATAVALWASCGSSPAQPTSSPSTIETPPAQRADGGAASDDSSSPPERDVDANDLGAACPTEPEIGRSQRRFLCDASGLVAGVWAPVDVLHDVPPEGAAILRDVPMQGDRGTSLRVGIAGTKIYVQHVTCGRCRRILGEAFAGDFTRLSDEDLRALQEHLGLPGDPLLRTADAWKAALGAG
jgi:hypothetical protein